MPSHLDRDWSSIVYEVNRERSSGIALLFTLLSFVLAYVRSILKCRSDRGVTEMTSMDQNREPEPAVKIDGCTFNGLTGFAKIRGDSRGAFGMNACLVNAGPTPGLFFDIDLTANAYPHVDTKPWLPRATSGAKVATAVINLADAVRKILHNVL